MWGGCKILGEEMIHVFETVCDKLWHSLQGQTCLQALQTCKRYLNRGSRLIVRSQPILQLDGWTITQFLLARDRSAQQAGDTA